MNLPRLYLSLPGINHRVRAGKTYLLFLPRGCGFLKLHLLSQRREEVYPASAPLLGEVTNNHFVRAQVRSDNTSFLRNCGLKGRSISDEIIQPYLWYFRREVVIDLISIISLQSTLFPGRISDIHSPNKVYTQLVANRAKLYTQILRRFHIVADSVNASSSRLPQKYASSTLLRGICSIHPYCGFNAPESASDGCRAVVADVHTDVRLYPDGPSRIPSRRAPSPHRIRPYTQNLPHAHLCAQ